MSSDDERDDGMHIHDTLARHGWSGLVMPDGQQPGVWRISRRDGGGIVTVTREGGGWRYRVYDADAAEPRETGSTATDDLGSLSWLIVEWVATADPQAAPEPDVTELHLSSPVAPFTADDLDVALLRILDGAEPGRPLSVINTDYLTRFGLVPPDRQDVGAVWALLHVAPGDDPELVPLYNLDGAPVMRACACGAYIDVDIHDEKGRLFCEACGRYYTDQGIALPNPDALSAD